MVTRVILILFTLIIHNSITQAQVKVIEGRVKDGHSDEMLPFASVRFKNSSIGKTTDSSGAFRFEFSKWPSDTLIITSVSYKQFIFIIPANSDSLNILAALEAGNAIAEVVVKSKAKHSRGWYLWRNVVKHRDSNNIFKNDNFTYHVYNKLEIDINNISQQKILKSRLLKPFKNILELNVDSVSENKPILPIFLSETLSDYYYQKSPYRTHEIIIANKISGVKNESITKYLGGLYQNVVTYDNYIPVFEKQFISPFNSNGDNFYNYRLADTQVVYGKRLLHLIFIPKHPGENTFTGDSWIHDRSFAIQKIILHVSKDANINFVDQLSIVQEFKLINDSTWFLSKDKFIVDINPLGNGSSGFIARKTTNYSNVLTNTDAVAPKVTKNKVIEEVELIPGVRQKEVEQQ